MLNFLCRKFVKELTDRANNPPPTVRKDILMYDVIRLLEAEFDEAFTRAAELTVPILFQNFATRFGPMERGKKTSDINSYFEHQKGYNKSPPTCHIQGETIDAKHFDYHQLLIYFTMDPSLCTNTINILDNPVEGDLKLVADFNCPRFILKRDAISQCIPCSSAHVFREFRDSVKFLFIRL